MTNDKYAHTLPGCSDTSRWQTLKTHLNDTASLAKEFAESFDSSEWARNAALLHDLGKLDGRFQKKLHTALGLEYEDETSSGSVNHSGAGAAWAERHFNAFTGRTLAYLIGGHHAGLPDYMSNHTGNASWIARKGEADKNLDLIQSEVGPYVSEWNANLKPPTFVNEKNYHHWVRMLFSCLVDADWLDTERFMDSQKYAARPKFPTIAELAETFDRHMRTFDSCEPTKLNRIRREILDHCRAAALQEPGLFTLTVPTGGGKTLSGMAFALKHAVEHGKKRIIYVIPYTSIIEQTAKTLRDIFGEENVVEHHSNIVYDENDEQKQKTQATLDLAAENWDAPIIVTTNVQFFESLYAAKSRRCRKLHNIAESVVLLDEAQLIAPEYLAPCVDVINELTANYKVSLVLCTATQPALRGINETRRIIPEAKEGEYYRALKRTNICFPKDTNERKTWEELSDELQKHDRVLCVVNTRLDCRTLYDMMRTKTETGERDTVHLSALMCGEHRSDVIKEIKRRLNDDPGPLRVISTQLVEAGVDMDFPVVYRALAGLDSIVQAAGRCNREGKLDDLGLVKVFVPPKPAPRGLLSKGEDTIKELLALGSLDQDDLMIYQLYFKMFYNKVERNNDITAKYKKMLIEEVSFDEHDEVGAAVDFRTFENIFQLIDDKCMVPIFVRYKKGDELIRQLEQEGPHRELMRKLQRYSVNLDKNRTEKLLDSGLIRKLELPGRECGIIIQIVKNCYQNEYGLDIMEETLSAEDSVI